MAIKTPVKATFSGSDVTGLAEYQTGDFIGLSHGGIGAFTIYRNGRSSIKSKFRCRGALEFGSSISHTRYRHSK